MEYLKLKAETLVENIKNLKREVKDYKKQLDSLNRKINDPRYSPLYEIFQIHDFIEICLSYLPYKWCTRCQGIYFGFNCPCRRMCRWVFVNNVTILSKGDFTKIIELEGEDKELIDYLNIENIKVVYNDTDAISSIKSIDGIYKISSHAKWCIEYTKDISLFIANHRFRYTIHI